MQNKEISNKTLTQIDPTTPIATISIDVRFDEDISTIDGVQTILANAKVASAELMEQPLIKDNTSSLEGELLIQKKGEVFLEVDNNGDLYISDEFAQDYEIDATGDLIFNQY